jgi:hypothetical protein
MSALQAFIKLAHAFRLEPAALARRDEHRTADVARHPAQRRRRIRMAEAVVQKQAFVQVPKAAVAHCCREAVVEGNTPRHEG